MANSKMFVFYGHTKADFISANLPAAYTNHIVFIKGDANGNGSCIYTHGMYFANFAELLAAVNYVKGVKVGESTYNATAGGGYIPFAAADNSTVNLDVQNGTITIGLTEAFVKKVDDVVALAATINGDYLKAADRTALEGLITAADGKAQSALDKANEVAEDVGNVDDLSTENKEVVKAINEVLAAVGTGGTAAVVTVTEKGSNDAYAQVYEIKQGNTTVGTINIPKELVVESGEVVTNPAGQPAGTYIKLILQNVTEPLYIDVAKLVDVYTSQQNATQVQLDIDASNVISATIVAGSITAAELAANAVVTAKIADKNVTKAKLADAVQSSLDKADAAAPQSTTYTKTEVDAMWDWEEL